MKRLIFLLLILLCLANICHARKRSRKNILKIIQLPAAASNGPISFERTLAARRSRRRFSDKPLDYIQLGQLAFAAQGISDPNTGYRTAPSAGAIYPITIFMATGKGLFEYLPEDHSLKQITETDLRKKLARAALNQQPIANAACDIIIAGSIKKLARKYGPKARRFMLLEAGHIAQNILLQAASMNLAAIPIGAFDINKTRRVAQLSLGLEPLYIIATGHRTSEIELQKESPKMNQISSAKALLIIPSKNFRDEELFETMAQLELAGIQTAIASTKTSTVTGMLGKKAYPDILITDMSVGDYDAIIFIGGSGAKEYFNNPMIMSIAKNALDGGKILAAICIAPSILANAGLLEGVTATCYSSEKRNLKQSGARISKSDVVQDGNIVTASGPKVATEFGRIVAEAIKNND